MRPGTAHAPGLPTKLPGAIHRIGKLEFQLRKHFDKELGKRQSR